MIPKNANGFKYSSSYLSKVHQRYVAFQQGVVLIYMDDHCVREETEAMERLKVVLETSEFGLELNLKKLKLLKRRIEFLSYIIEDGSIFPSRQDTCRC